MNDEAPTLGRIVLIAVLVLVSLGIWGLLVVLGIKVAKKKNRSPHWMWFGVHPVGALVVFIVMMALDPLKVCPQCGHASPPDTRICPYCAYSFVPAPTPGAPPAA